MEVEKQKIFKSICNPMCARWNSVGLDGTTAGIYVVAAEQQKEHNKQELILWFSPKLVKIFLLKNESKPFHLFSSMTISKF